MTNMVKKFDVLTDDVIESRSDVIEMRNRNIEHEFILNSTDVIPDVEINAAVNKLLEKHIKSFYSNVSKDSMSDCIITLCNKDVENRDISDLV